jgi:hypothetical protein
LTESITDGIDFIAQLVASLFTDEKKSSVIVRGIERET